MMRLLLPLVLIIGACVHRHVPQYLPDDLLPAADSLAVRSLAAQAGLHRPSSLELHCPLPMGRTVGCPVFRVSSDTTVEGARRSWTELLVYRTGRDASGRRCKVYRESGDTIWRLSSWMASSAGRSAESLWRVHDGAWHVDVRLDPDVTYDEASVIVRAVRRGELENAMPAVLRRLFRLDTLPAFDASDIRSVRGSARERGDATHIVVLGNWAGQVLYVSIVAGKVLLYNIGSHIS
jgi:hypothetical protein